MTKTISLLGSTGSIGRQTLEVCRELGVRAALSEVWAKGGQGGVALAEKVLETLETERRNIWRSSWTLRPTAPRWRT